MFLYLIGVHARQKKIMAYSISTYDLVDTRYELERKHVKAYSLSSWQASWLPLSPLLPSYLPLSHLQRDPSHRHHLQQPN